MKLLALGVVGIKLVSAAVPDCDPACTADNTACKFTSGSSGAAECKTTIAVCSALEPACTEKQNCAFTEVNDGSVHCVNKVASPEEVTACAKGQLVHSMKEDADVWTCNKCGDFMKQGATVYDACEDDANACVDNNPCGKDQTCNLVGKSCDYYCEWNQSFTDPGKDANDVAIAFEASKHCKFNKDACDKVNNPYYSRGCSDVQKCTATETTATCANDDDLLKCKERCGLKKAHFELEGTAECCTEAYNKDEKCTAPKKQTETQKKTCTDAWKPLSVDANDKCEDWDKDYCDGSMSIAFGMVTFAMMFLF